MLNKVSLNTIGLNRIGLNRIGKPSRGSSDRPYIDPEVLASLKAVCICYGKSNDDPDRAVVKNLVDPDNPFVISNAAFKLNSGFGKYEVDFATWKFRPSASENLTISNSSVSIKSELPDEWIIWQQANSSAFKIRIKGLHDGGQLRYRYFDIDNVQHDIFFNSNGDFDCPANFNTGKTSGFAVEGTKTIYVGLTIEQIPSFEGAFVTDGIDDLITSTKTAEEMGITDEVTVVSMIHQINANKNFTTTNNLRNENRVIGRNTVTNIGKTGIYGWYKKDIQGTTATLIDNILGDKNDYTGHYTESTNSVANSKFYVTGYAVENGFTELSSVAWYWNFISNKYLTTDQINQVIAYFNLDRTLNPDILCNTIKQGITNENHAEFGDKLIDFSGNGRDIQLNNIAWKGDSGIGKYNFSNINIIASNRFEGTVTTNKCHFTKKLTDTTNNFCDLLVISPNEPIKFKVSGLSDGRKLFVANKSGSGSNYNFDNGEHEVSLSFSEGVGQNNPFGVTGDIGDIDVTVEFIPSHEGALCLDGVNDFGKVTGMPIYKDYTFIAEREFLNETFPNQVCLVSKSKVASEIENGGAFIVDNISVNSIINPYSFYKTTSLPGLNTFDRQIVFQSKYKYLDKDIAAGTATDSDTLWLGTFRDNDSRFANVAIYFLMSFPYSMSEFLIERQLKKHKLGTLYPDMVEFRPIIKQDDRIKNVKYYKLNETADYIDLNIGDYIPVGQRIAIVVDLEEPYEITSITSSSLTNVEIRKAGGQNYAYDILGYVTDKSPQKITIDIEVDTDLIQFNPTINSNVILEVGNEQNMTELIAKVRNHEIDGFIMYLSKLESKYILPNSWINKDAEIIASIYCLDNILQDDFHINIDGNSKYCLYADSSNNIAEFIIMDDNIFEEQYITNVLTANTIDIQLDQYIRYEDIVQPYPVLLRFNDENGNEVSWGGKFRVGSTITRIGSFYENNLIDGLYIVRNPKLNGNNLITPTHVVEKSMVFTCDTEYLLDNNEPKCILSPSRLRIPNSSYKILGYIPDISGHGNHGVIHNSAYTKESGVNGYVENFNDWIISKSPVTVEKTDSQAHISHIGTSYKTLPIFEYTNPKVINDYTLTVEITGIPNDCIGKFIHVNTYTQEVTNGINTIKFENNAGWFGFTFYREDGSIIGDCNITIKQIGEYEGAYCLDGVNDFVTIPTLSSGGKQVLMKVNWESDYGKVLYDQRLYTSGLFAIIAISEAPAYETGNGGGKTYIDGILNKNILSKELASITHNIILNNNYTVTNSNIFIGTNYANTVYAKMALYDFMLFDSISTDDKILELNEYVGIEAKVELPPYYWDAYGKTNLDADKATIQQRGVAVGDYDLTNYNHAYEGMSGYNGYPVVFGAGKTLEVVASVYNYTSDVTSTTIHVTMVKNAGTGLLFSYVKKDGALTNIKEIPAFRVTVKGLEGNSKLGYRYLATEDATGETLVYLGNGTHELAKSFAPTEALLDLTRNAWVGIFITPMVEGEVAFDCDITIEVLPEYENGLVYDGVTDYSENVNIPAFTDFTYILKRQILKGIANSAVMYKGNITVNQGGAFICNYCEPSDTNLFTDFSFGGLLRSNDIDKPIIYGTKTSVNGDSITPGENIDTVGINVGKWVNYLPMVFYKLILYPKTIPLLQINFLKNLMERDEIIDLNNPIFIQE